jgi:hypothetical protein
LIGQRWGRLLIRHENRWGKESSVLIVVLVVLSGPIGAADVAEFMLADAGHVVAALELVNDHLAAGALAIVKSLLEELQLKFIADSHVDSEEAVRAELGTACAAVDLLCSLLHLHKSFTVLTRAHFKRGILDG